MKVVNHAIYFTVAHHRNCFIDHPDFLSVNVWVGVDVCEIKVDVNALLSNATLPPLFTWPDQPLYQIYLKNEGVKNSYRPIHGSTTGIIILWHRLTVTFRIGSVHPCRR